MRVGTHRAVVVVLWQRIEGLSVPRLLPEHAPGWHLTARPARDTRRRSIKHPNGNRGFAEGQKRLELWCRISHEGRYRTKALPALEIRPLERADSLRRASPNINASSA